MCPPCSGIGSVTLAAPLAFVAPALTMRIGFTSQRRWLYLAPDALLLLSAVLTPVFQGYSGTLDAQGRATATFAIPNDPGLIGLHTCTAFITFAPSAPSGIDGISNTVRLWIER